MPDGAGAETGRTVNSRVSRLTVTAKAGESALFCNTATNSCGAVSRVASRKTTPIASIAARPEAPIAAARQRARRERSATTVSFGAASVGAGAWMRASISAR